MTRRPADRQPICGYCQEPIIGVDGAKCDLDGTPHVCKCEQQNEGGERAEA